MPVEFAIAKGSRSEGHPGLPGAGDTVRSIARGGMTDSNVVLETSKHRTSESQRSPSEACCP